MLPAVMNLVRVSAFGTMVLGAAVGGYVLAGKVTQPLPLVCTLVGTGILLIALGVGLLRRSRVAWAFSIAALGVMLVAAFLAVPALVRSGFSQVGAGLLLAAIVGLFGALIMNRSSYS